MSRGVHLGRNINDLHTGNHSNYFNKIKGRNFVNSVSIRRRTERQTHLQCDRLPPKDGTRYLQLTAHRQTNEAPQFKLGVSTRLGLLASGRISHAINYKTAVSRSKNFLYKHCLYPCRTLGEHLRCTTFELR